MSSPDSDIDGVDPSTADTGEGRDTEGEEGVPWSDHGRLGAASVGSADGEPELVAPVINWDLEHAADEDSHDDPEEPLEDMVRRLLSRAKEDGEEDSVFDNDTNDQEGMGAIHTAADADSESDWSGVPDAESERLESTDLSLAEHDSEPVEMTTGEVRLKLAAESGLTEDELARSLASLLSLGGPAHEPLRSGFGHRAVQRTRPTSREVPEAAAAPEPVVEVVSTAAPEAAAAPEPVVEVVSTAAPEAAAAPEPVVEWTDALASPGDNVRSEPTKPAHSSRASVERSPASGRSAVEGTDGPELQHGAQSTAPAGERAEGPKPSTAVEPVKVPDVELFGASASAPAFVGEPAEPDEEEALATPEAVRPAAHEPMSVEPEPESTPAAVGSPMSGHVPASEQLSPPDPEAFAAVDSPSAPAVETAHSAPEATSPADPAASTLVSDADRFEWSAADAPVAWADASGAPDQVPVLVPATHLTGHHVDEYVSAPIVPVRGVVSPDAEFIADRSTTSVPMPVRSVAPTIAMDSDRAYDSTGSGGDSDGVGGMSMVAGAGAVVSDGSASMGMPLYAGDFIDEEDVLIDEEEALESELLDHRSQGPLIAEEDFDEVEFAEYMASRRQRVLPGQRAGERDPSDWTTWSRLLRVRAREVVFGPLQEHLWVDVYTHGFRIHRSKLSQLIRGEERDEDGEEGAAYTIPFGSLVCEEDGNSVQMRWNNIDTNATEELVLAGDGAVAITAALEAVEDDRPLLSVASFARLSMFGFVSVNGVAFVGQNGVVFSPLGLVSGVLGRIRKFAADQFTRIERVEQTIEFTRVGKSKPSLWMDGSEVTIGAIAAWWSGQLLSKVKAVTQPMPVVWYPDGSVAHLATATLVRGGIELEAVADSSTRVRSAGVHVVFESVSAMSLDAAPELQARIRGVLNRIWLLEGARPQMMLRDHLKREAFTVWPEDWDVSQWKRCMGSFAAARMLLANEQEQVLYPVVASDSGKGILLTAPVPLRATATLFRGARVECELLTMRQGQVFRGTITRLSKDVVTDDEDEPKLEVELFPSSDEPLRRASRRSAHRVEVVERVRVALTMEYPQMPRMRGYLSDLSAGGCRVILDRGSYPEGISGRVRIPMKRGAATFECEVLHDLKEVKGEGRSSVGLRFIGLMEQGRSELQREVLWRERRNKKFAPGELKD